MACDFQLATADEATIAFVREGKPGEAPSYGNLAVTSGSLATEATVALGTVEITLAATAITAGTTINTGEELKIEDDTTLYRVCQAGIAAGDEIVIGITPPLQVAISGGANGVQRLGAPFFKGQRMTGETIDNTPESIVSNEITGDAQDKDSKIVGGGNTGGYGIEFSFDSFDEMVSAVGRGTFTEKKMTEITFAISSGTITDSGSGFISQGGFLPKMKITLSGFSNAQNNGSFFIDSVAAGVITLAAGSGVTDESAGSSFTLVQEYFDGISVQGTTFAIAGTGTTITDSGSGFVTDGFYVGQIVSILGFTTAANNCPCLVSAVAAGSMSITSMIGNTLVDEIAGDTVTITANTLRNGTDLRSYSVEKKLNTSVYHNFLGQRNNSIALEFAAKSIITGNIAQIGQSIGETTATLDSRGEYTPVNDNDVMDATSNIGGLLLNGSDLGENGDYIRNWSVNILNNLRPVDAAGYLESVAVNNGSASNTGAIAMYFRDDTYYTLFRNNTAMAFKFYITDGNGNYLFFHFPRIKFTGFPVQATGKNTDIVAEGNFQAFPDVDLGYVFQIDKVTA